MAKLNLKLMLWKFACCSAWHCVLKCKHTNITNSAVEETVREAIHQEKCSFFNIVTKAFDPPPPFV